MSHHHHHPNEGHSPGQPRSMRTHLHHNWFFYVSGIFILLGLLAFIWSGNLAWNTSPVPAHPPLPITGSK